jgi:hypothetical protein
MSDDDSYSSSDELPDGEQYTSTTAVGEPYCRDQGSFLFNLQKLLNEANLVGGQGVIRWHRKISNALEINWTEFAKQFATVHPVFVQYKLSRASNRFACVRPTMNRKLREWKFHMVSVSAPCPWVTYVYETASFCMNVTHDILPTNRRQKFQV